MGAPQLGTLAPLAYADLIVISWKGSLRDSLFQAEAEDVLLVIAQGKPLYGQASILRQLVPKIHHLGPSSDKVYGFPVQPLFELKQK